MSNGDSQVALREPTTGIVLGRAPEIVLAEAQRAARALKDVLDAKPKKVVINGETYPEFEDWSTCGSFYNVTAGADDAVPCEVDGVSGAKAMGYAVRADTGIRISSAVAYCMRDEEQWAEKPWFQLASMAQTRAAAKSLRNVLSRIMVLAGARPTPAEEMNGLARSEPRPACPECGKPGAVIRGKPEYGGGWVCFKKKGGCGAKWLDAPEVKETSDLPAEELTELDKAWAKVKEVREAKGMGKDQVQDIIREMWPSTKGNYGLLSQNMVEVLAERIASEK